MELNEYQRKAMSTCTRSSANFAYMFLNLVGEVGEFSSKIAKAIRKERAAIKSNDLSIYIDSLQTVGDWENETKKELGDILWQLAGVCDIMGWHLEDIAQMNLDKLASRADRGVIIGEGDNR